MKITPRPRTSNAGTGSSSGTSTDLGACDVLLSVVIPTRNRLEMLKSVVASVLDQCPPGVAGATGACVEVCVADDGSTDGTGEWLRSQRRIQPGVIRRVRPQGRGEAAARNAGVRIAQGTWVLFLDDDDALAPGALDRLLPMLEHERLDSTNATAAFKTRGRAMHPVPTGDAIPDADALHRDAATSPARPGNGTLLRTHQTLVHCLASRGAFGGVGGLIVRRTRLRPEPFGHSQCNCADVAMQLAHGGLGPVVQVLSPPLWLVRTH
jgi:glycosyltransferase involved in cell wall biosynthesis